MVTNLRQKNSNNQSLTKYSEWTLNSNLNDDQQATHTTKMPIVNVSTANGDHKRNNNNKSSSHKLKFIQTIENEMDDGEFEVYCDDFEDDDNDEEQRNEDEMVIMKKRREKKSMQMKEAYKPILPNDIYKQYYGSKSSWTLFNYNQY